MDDRTFKQATLDAARRASPAATVRLVEAVWEAIHAVVSLRTGPYGAIESLRSALEDLVEADKMPPPGGA